MEWCGCVLHMQVFTSVSFLIMALPHTHHRHSNVSLNFYYTVCSLVLPAVLTYISLQASEFMVMLPFSIQRGYNGNGIGYQKGNMRMLHGTYQVYTLDGQLNALFIHIFIICFNVF